MATSSAPLSSARLLDRRGVDRGDVRQVLRDARPALALVLAGPHVAVRCAEVEAHRIETIVVHPLANGFHRRALGQALIESIPGLALVSRAVHADPERRGGAPHAVKRDAVRGARVARVDRRGEPEVRRESLRAEAPGRLARIAPVHLFVNAHEPHAALHRMCEELVDAIEDVRALARGAVDLVVLHPRRRSVLTGVDAPDAYADLHLLGILRVDRDRVEAHAAEPGHPLRAGRLVVEALHDRPRLAAVLTLEERGRLRACPDALRRLLVSRPDVPGLRQGTVRPPGEPRVLRGLPRLSRVPAHFDARSAPRLVHGCEHRSVARVVGRVVDLRRRELGTLAGPRAAARVAAEDVVTLLRTTQDRHILRHRKPPLIS